MKNTVAYYGTEEITAVKSFILPTWNEAWSIWNFWGFSLLLLDVIWMPARLVL